MHMANYLCAPFIIHYRLNYYRQQATKASESVNTAQDLLGAIYIGLVGPEEDIRHIYNYVCILK